MTLIELEVSEVFVDLAARLEDVAQLAEPAGPVQHCIAPGLVDTAMARQMRPEMMEMFLNTVPLHRLAQVEELGHTAKYIFENDYLTGRVIELDGGTRV